MYLLGFLIFSFPPLLRAQEVVCRLTPLRVCSGVYLNFPSFKVQCDVPSSRLPFFLVISFFLIYLSPCSTCMGMQFLCILAADEDVLDHYAVRFSRCQPVLCFYVFVFFAFSGSVVSCCHCVSMSYDFAAFYFGKIWFCCSFRFTTCPKFFRLFILPFLLCLALHVWGRF